MAQDPRADRKSIFNKWDNSSYLESSFFIFQRNPCQNNLRQIWRLFPRFVAIFVVCCDRFQAPFPVFRKLVLLSIHDPGQMAQLRAQAIKIFKQRYGRNPKMDPETHQFVAEDEAIIQEIIQELLNS